MKVINNIPALICDPCLRALYEADEFRLRCLKADEWWNQVMMMEESEGFEDKYEAVEFLAIEEENPDCKIEFTEPTESTAKVKYSKGQGIESQTQLQTRTAVDQLSPTDFFVCDLCARIFQTKQSLKSHFIRAHTPKTEVFPCSICGKVLPHQKALYAHERVHIKNEVICQYCSKVFSRKVLLSSHIAIVHLKKRL